MVRFASVIYALAVLEGIEGVQGFTPSKSYDVKQSLRSTSPVHKAVSAIPTTSSQSLHKNRGGARNAWPLTRDPKGMSPDYPLAAARIGITISSTFFTWYAQKQYSNVMASAAFTLICSMLFDKRLGQAAFCGTFAGMCSKAVLPSWQLALGLGAVTSFMYEALIHYGNFFLGLGGRLGFTAFLATSLVTAASGVSTGFNLSSITIDSLKKSTILPMALWHAVGSVATIVLRESTDDSQAADPVRASAVVGLAGALLLQRKEAALAVYGGSFVGMALPSRLMHGILPGKGTAPPATVASILTAFALAGALGGLVHGATIDWGFWPGGWGGKAGTCAFVGCLIYRGIEKTLATIRGKKLES